MKLDLLLNISIKSREFCNIVHSHSEEITTFYWHGTIFRKNFAQIDRIIQYIDFMKHCSIMTVNYWFFHTVLSVIMAKFLQNYLTLACKLVSCNHYIFESKFKYT